MNNKRNIFSYCIVFLMMFYSCTTVSKYNASLERPKSAADLKADVDYIHRLLKNAHPDLYRYITKNELDARFDSLKASITDSLTSRQFYFRLSPVIASIRQGHTQTSPAGKRLTSKEIMLANAHGLSPLSRLELEIFNNKLYIVNNYSTDSTLKAGTEIVSIDKQLPSEIIEKYKKTFTSDGFNETFLPRRTGRIFARYFYYEHGIKDSLHCVLRYQDSIRTKMLYRIPKIKPTPEKTSAETSKLLKSKKKIQGYDGIKKQFSKELRFLTKDSSVALMRIADFSKGNYKKFYKNSFTSLNKAHTNTLILDIRDNPGGRLEEIFTLYKYLSDTTFTFMTKSEVSSRTGMWYNGYFGGFRSVKDAPRIILLPFVLEYDLITLLKTHRDDNGKFYFKLSQAKAAKPYKDRFTGKVYVIINGGCFSASSILSTHLKKTGRATFVGTETGGAYNGCVAGFMPGRQLPHSKVNVSFGLMEISTPYSETPDGRGIFPDTSITPTVTDRVNGRDPEMEWILEEIRSKK